MLGQRPDGFGYLNKPEENKKVLVQIDGKTFFRTGDKGYISESGHMFLTGRYKRLMKRPDGVSIFCPSEYFRFFISISEKDKSAVAA